MDLKPGTKLKILPESLEKNTPETELDSVFTQELEDGLFVAAAPFLDRDLYPLHVGELLYIAHQTPKTVSLFTAQVEDRFKRGGSYFFQARLLSQITARQRRADFRLEVSLPVKFRFPDQAGFSEARARDLSGGGLSLQTDTTMALGDRMILRVPVPLSDLTLEIPAEVCWCSAQPENALFFVGLRFLYRKKQDKETMVKTLFRLQQKGFSEMARDS